MHWIARSMYEVYRTAIRLYLRTFVEFQVWGQENLSETPTPCIYCSNHFSSTDPFFVITLMKEPVHMVIGPGFSVPIVKHFLKWMEQINALPQHRKEVIPQALFYLLKKESIYIFPEGDLNNQVEFREFYHGMAKIYKEFQSRLSQQLSQEENSSLPHQEASIIPIGIVSPRSHVKRKSATIHVGENQYETLTVLSGKYYANIGKPMYFPPDMPLENITEQVRKQLEYLIWDIKVNKFWS
ncbi:lysophospholipid acyltransferase family protein [Thermospira aquatica]|uniref:1-acyl-sn-glycerol-3-phosphate acyltransferase n=1 Tax=Thermospira aquatica TaxID=2828656 RepID=A0AAX3BCR2_9SPIR|nr:lysophospholipid acyltransferase family protein [Thermospira aquatica]URA10072.1 1-acyl-sn-glycerol-3-phosphate acyltransferase [Thermospira aquatica]